MTSGEPERPRELFTFESEEFRRFEYLESFEYIEYFAKLQRFEQSEAHSETNSPRISLKFGFRTEFYLNSSKIRSLRFLVKIT